jgi:hypothetical protein
LWHKKNTPAFKEGCGVVAGHSGEVRNLETPASALRGTAAPGVAVGVDIHINLLEEER